MLELCWAYFCLLVIVVIIQRGLLEILVGLCYLEADYHFDYHFDDDKHVGLESSMAN